MQRNVARNSLFIVISLLLICASLLAISISARAEQNSPKVLNGQIAPLVAYLPMASLAALLLIVAKNMGEARHFAHIVKVAPRSDVVVLLVCFTLTVLFDMVLSVSVGVVLAALLFMRRMAERLLHEEFDLLAPRAFDVPSLPEAVSIL